MNQNAAILSVVDVDLQTIVDERNAHNGYLPSPDAWEDETLYFLLLDRFSDGGETDRPCFDPAKHGGNAIRNERDAKEWRESGNTFTGGTLRGLTEKIGYIAGMGVTTIWVSPVLKQAPFATHDYHGYGTQNFYEIEPRFGTREDFVTLVNTAHEHGIRVILDIIINHCADCFEYDREANRVWTGETFPVKGFRDETGAATVPFQTLDTAQHRNAAVWPRELQDAANFSRKGAMVNWDNWPEYEEGDFFGFKDFVLGDYTGGDETEETDRSGDNCAADVPEFVPSPALVALTAIYKYWIALADLDGFRIDTVKHMGPAPACWFAREIRTFTQSLGKRNFFLVGEIAGGRAHAHWMLGQTGLDAALGIDEIPETLRGVVRGETSPCEYFAMFVNEFTNVFVNTKREQTRTDDPNWWRNRVVTFFDDHDQVGRATKERFASVWGGDAERAASGIVRALAFNLLTLGIPCVYYGTEQGFDGHAGQPGAGDRYLRETMHGAAFGSFGSQGAHFFDHNAPIYTELAKLLVLRKDHAALRRGLQYLRPVSTDGELFYEPERIGDPYRGVVAWSRIEGGDEFVCALNTDEEKPHTVWITVDPRQHAPGKSPLRYLYSTNAAQTGNETDAPTNANGASVCVTVPAGGFVLLR